MVDQLRPGMNKRQVVYYHGLAYAGRCFPQKSLGYFYYDKPDGEDKVQKQLSLYFENDQLSAFRETSDPAPCRSSAID